MCGIAGYIGKSKKPKLTYKIITNLFKYLEIRGVDASGVWTTETGNKGRVFYHKEPIKSSQFVQKRFWKNLRNVKTNLMLVHARATSKGGGHASTNSNNHPFVNSDKRIGMVHNGTLEEANFLKSKYQTTSQTDSEVLLRMYEHGMDKNPLDIEACSEISKRMNGIEEIWSLISKGAMAVSFGERVDENTRYLFMFRNDKRPLWIADLRDVLGQIFFFSSPEIWFKAIGDLNEFNNFCFGSEKLIEIPSEQVWVFKIDEKEPHVSNESEFYRFGIDIDKNHSSEWKINEVKSVKSPEINLNIVSNLDDDENIITKNNSNCASAKKYKSYDKKCTIDQNLFQNGGTEHEEICKQIKDLVFNIEMSASNSVMEGSMSPNEYLEIVESLEQTRVDLEGTFQLICH